METKKNLLDYGFPLFLYQEKERREKKERQLDIRDFFLNLSEINNKSPTLSRKTTNSERILKPVGESEVEDNHHKNKEDENDPHHQP